MLKNLRIGLKMALGFGLVILLVAAVGGIAIVNMEQIKSESLRLKDEYVPEVAIANNVERSSLLTMYAMRGYSLNFSEEFRATGTKELTNVFSFLTEAEAHVEKFPRLTVLKEGVAAAREEALLYQSLVKETEDVIEGIESARVQNDKAAQIFMENCNAYLDSQNESMLQDIRNRAGAGALESRLTKILLINSIIEIGNSMRIANFKGQLFNDPESMEAALKLLEQMDELVAEIRIHTSREVNIRQLDLIEKSGADYAAAMSSIIAGYTSLKEINAERGIAGEKVLESSKSVASTGISNTQNIANSAVEKVRSSVSVVIAGLAVALFLGLMIAVLLTRMITGALRKGVQFAEFIARGDLTARLDVDQKDEIGMLALSLKQMSEKLKEIVGNVRTAADNVASGSRELSNSSVQMSTGATEQASSAEEVSSSIEEMGANIQQNSSNAVQTEKIATKSARDAEEGGQAVNEAVEAMKLITEKINVIESIARETNMLSLNAAIEAARAGEHGKGFAVVATEVGKLAANSQKASVEIQKLAISSMEKANAAREKIQAIVPDIKRTAELVVEIAASSAEQNSGAEQINQAMLQLDSVIQQNAAVAEESSSMSEELTSQAEQLLDLISFFKVDEAGSSSRRNLRKEAGKNAGPNAPSRAAQAPARSRTMPALPPADREGSEGFEEF